MSLMKLLSFDNTLNMYTEKNLFIKKKTKHLFKMVKSIYNSKKKHKNLKLQSKSDLINIYFSNFYYLNVILNNITKK
jgi:hypothetical protein